MQTMSDTTWTPGPWRVEGIWEEGFGARDRDREPADLWTIDPVMTAGGYDGLWHGGVEREADARLIAAAPEMAELLGVIERNDFLSGWEDELDRDIRALLSRIRGA